MAVTLAVVPDFSAFVTPTAVQISKAVGCDEATAELFLQHFVVLPRVSGE